MPKVNYIYAELTSTSVEKLKNTLPFRFNRHFGTYITLDWKVDSFDYLDIIGKKYKLIVDTIASDSHCEAISVSLTNSELKSVNKNPHITWSVDDNFEPYYCNYMLEVTAKNTRFPPVEIEVVVKNDLF